MNHYEPSVAISNDHCQSLLTKQTLTLLCLKPRRIQMFQQFSKALWSSTMKKLADPTLKSHIFQRWTPSSPFELQRWRPKKIDDPPAFIYVVILGSHELRWVPLASSNSSSCRPSSRLWCPYWAFGGRRPARREPKTRHLAVKQLVAEGSWSMVNNGDLLWCIQGSYGLCIGFMIYDGDGLDLWWLMVVMTCL